MILLKRTLTIWRIRGIGAPALTAVSRLARVKLPLAGMAAALARLAEQRAVLPTQGDDNTSRRRH
jgi:hypothetical protein